MEKVFSDVKRILDVVLVWCVSDKTFCLTLGCSPNQLMLGCSPNFLSILNKQLPAQNGVK